MRNMDWSGFGHMSHDNNQHGKNQHHLVDTIYHLFIDNEREPQIIIIIIIHEWTYECESYSGKWNEKTFYQRAMVFNLFYLVFFFNFLHHDDNMCASFCVQKALYVCAFFNNSRRFWSIRLLNCVCVCVIVCRKWEKNQIKLGNKSNPMAKHQKRISPKY